MSSEEQDRYQHPVSPERLAECRQANETPPGMEQLIDDERALLKARREQQNRPAPSDGNVSALAISGGGIRSATFALGVLQSLAAHDLLKRFDYLSTVSGGGYIGSSLSWFTSGLSGSKFTAEKDAFPYGTSPPHESNCEDGQAQRQLLDFLRQHGKYLTPGKCITAWSLAAVLLRGIFLNLLVWIPILVALFTLLLWDAEPGTFSYTRSFQVILLLAGTCGLVFMLGSIAYSFGTFSKRRGHAKRYEWRRRFECWGGRLLKAGLAFTVLGSLPWVAAQVFGGLGPLLSAAGAASGGWSFSKTSDDGEAVIPLGLVAALAAALFLYGILLSSYMLAAHLPLADLMDWRMWLFVFLLVLALASGLRVNINYISVHRYYRDRLMEAFMPGVDAALKNKTGASKDADHARLSEMAGTGAPYHIINTNIVLVDSDYPRYRKRGGDSFILSPLYCGSGPTGWRSTESYMNNNMTLATAMAISGAAANPNTGVGGAGPTRNELVSVLMALLNIRLGYWARNPACGKDRSSPPNHFDPGLYEVFCNGYTADRPFVQLSDGGHFENLGVYEMIRRRARLIVALDGAADTGFSFADLNNALDRIEEDFGVYVEFHDDLGQLTPSVEMGFPDDAKRARFGFVCGTIHYDEQTTGILVFAKTTLVDGLSEQTRAYRAEHPDFPDESTADQFFDTRQFEAYRDLGYRIGESMAGDIANYLDQLDRGEVPAQS